MAVLGIEGTAHTLGVGVVEESEPGRCRVLANRRAMVRPPAPGAEGGPAAGIHPREAANHHAEAGPAILQQALDEAGVLASELEAVAFSRGPGLGPCLRVAATMARALALRAGKPLVGVNHCVAHLEIGRGLQEPTDPMLLYVSGANTQVVAFVRGRYRVFGETLDIGLGNALDKFARDHGIPFPGGPEVERLAATAPRSPLRPLPYAVKGMDLSFAGLATAATRLVQDGAPLSEVCHAFQEHAFAAVVETAERALAHTGKASLVLGGGVACNARLQEMARRMCEARGVASFAPPRDLLVDNGAMIAWLGLLQLRAGDTLDVAESQVRPYERTDAVEASWRPEVGHSADPATTSSPAASAQEGHRIALGAEAEVRVAGYMGRPGVEKRRLAKAYRHAELDARLRDERTRDEGNLIAAARRAGVPVPVLYDVDRGAATLRMERVHGRTLRDALAAGADGPALLQRLGTLVGRLHAAGVTHGDLTTSNVLVREAGVAQAAGTGGESGGEELVLIDFGLGEATSEPEPRGVDLHLLEEALEATHPHAATLHAGFLDAYAASSPGAPEAIRRLEEIRRRGRHRA